MRASVLCLVASCAIIQDAACQGNSSAQAMADSLLIDAIAAQQAAYYVPGHGSLVALQSQLGEPRFEHGSGWIIVRRAYHRKVYAGALISQRFHVLGGFVSPEVRAVAGELGPCWSGGLRERAEFLAALLVDDRGDAVVRRGAAEAPSEEWSRLWDIYVRSQDDSIMLRRIYARATELSQGVVVPVLLFSVQPGEAVPFDSSWLLSDDCRLLAWRSSRGNEFEP